MKSAEQIYAEFKEPFDLNAIHWRTGATNAKKLGVKPWQATKGIALAYLNARDVMKRLDDVVGMENWQDRYPYPGCCELSIKINGEWITKTDAGAETDVEAIKGQSSDGFKRAAVKFGIGRYLYYLPNTWVDLVNGQIKTPPKLPSWAVPKGVKQEEAKTFHQILEIGSPIIFQDFWKRLDVEEKIAYANSFDDKRNGGTGLGKTEGKKIIRKMESEAPIIFENTLTALEQAIENQDQAGVAEILEELDEHEGNIMLGTLAPHLRSEYNELMLGEVE